MTQEFVRPHESVVQVLRLNENSSAVPFIVHEGPHVPEDFFRLGTLRRAPVYVLKDGLLDLVDALTGFGAGREHAANTQGLRDARQLRLVGPMLQSVAARDDHQNGRLVNEMPS